MYIYLSNEDEHPVDVFFDDFRVEHVKGPVVQVEDYYPFGLAFNSFQRENFYFGICICIMGRRSRMNWDWIGWIMGRGCMYSEIARFFENDRFAEKYQ